MVVVMTPMRTTPPVLEAVKAAGLELRRYASGSEHKSLESPRLHSLDMLQQNILDLEQHENLVVIRHGDPFRKTGRIP